jgi:DNA-binding NtrC family response regulator
MHAIEGHRETILIVDDDPAVLVLIQTILVAAGYRVLPTTERADAVRMARQKHIHIDLALLDVRLPGVAGTELADEILSIRPDVRVLWMSGFVDEEFVRVKLVDGYAGFLPKPLRRDGLLSAVEEAIHAAPRYQLVGRAILPAAGFQPAGRAESGSAA